jgi:hypothetical protein
MADTEEPAPPPSRPVPPGPTRARPWLRDVLLVVITAAVVLVAQAVLTNGDDEDGDDEDVATDTTPSDDATTTTDQSETTETTTSRVRTGNFEDGLWAVGSEIQPGRYIVTGIAETGCSWARLSDVSGDNVIVAQDRAAHQAIVDILESDGAFRSDGCGVWEVYEPRNTPPLSTIEEGDWIVGDQIEPGNYQSESASSCGWTRATAFEHTAQEVIASLPPEPRPRTILTVELVAGDRFSSSGCETWVKTG